MLVVAIGTYFIIKGKIKTLFFSAFFQIVSMPDKVLFLFVFSIYLPEVWLIKSHNSC